MIMPYGKFKGQDITAIHSGYLKWIAENIQEKTRSGKEICRAADKEWQWREKHGCHFNENGR